jgi:NADH dehydrogenase
VRVVLDDVKRFDFEANRATTARQELSYDYLIIAVGSAPNYFDIPGLEAHGFPLWSIEDAVTIRDHIERCFAEARTEMDPARRRSLLTFVVGGAGFTGVEMIGELAQWSKKLCSQYDIRRSDVQLYIADMLPRILSSLPEKPAQKARRYMENTLGVKVLLNTAIKEVTADSIDLGDRKIETRTLIWAAGVRASCDVDLMSLEKGPARRLCVDEYCRTKHQNVFAIGDVSALTNEKGNLYPAMVETALQTAEGVAENILRDIRGQKPEPVRVKLHGVMVSVGNYFAVADLMGMQPGRWISLFMKFLVNAHYLYGIMGVKGVWDYLRDEILHRRQHKRFLQSNYTRTVQAWWLVPLRLYLGWTWFYEGIEKILDGWLKSSKLAAFLGRAADGVSSATQTAEAVTGATGAVDGGAVVEKLMNIDLGFIGFFIERAGEDAPLVFRMKFFLVDWILNGWVFATEGWTMFFQVLIVIMELLVGLAIFSGTLTFLASVASLGLLAMFITTTGMYSTEWWMIFASIAIAAGAGRAFGLDHWLLPWLGRVWGASKKNGQLMLTFAQRRYGKR